MLTLTGRVFKMRDGLMGKRKTPTYFVDVIVDEVGLMSCAIYVDDVSVVPSVGSDISANVTGIRVFGERVAFSIANLRLLQSAVASSSPPAPPVRK